VRLSGLVSALIVAALLCGYGLHRSSAMFTGTKPVSTSNVHVHALADDFLVTPGVAVQPGTGTLIANGNVDLLTMDFGTIPSARSITGIFTVKNISSGTLTAQLTPALPGQLPAFVFTSTGTTSAVLSAGASASVQATSSSTFAGHGTGTVKLGEAGLSWLYRSYTLVLNEAPEAPTALNATAAPA
jgi:hypothetical protein